MDKIIVKGARENNLKNIDIAIPKNKLTVITGVSGSGKSSLAFDTIYAEGESCPALVVDNICAHHAGYCFGRFGG